jgi:hypothetical protein
MALSSVVYIGTLLEMPCAALRHCCRLLLLLQQLVQAYAEIKKPLLL